MAAKLIITTIISLIIALLFSLFWVNLSSPYSLQLMAALMIIFLLNYKLTKNKLFNSSVNLAVFSTAVLILVSETGGLSSPLFFLIYFLLFGVAFLSSPSVVLACTLAIILFFSPSLKTVNAVIQLASLILITPLAIIFGKQYLELLKQQGRIVILKKEKGETEKSLKKQETSILIWISLNLKNGLTEIGDYLSQLLSDISHSTPSQQELLKKAHRKTKGLLKERSGVQKIIDRETD